MATGADVVAAIDHILRHKPTWRGTLNDSDFAALKDIYQRAKQHRENMSTPIDDKYLGALRLDNPTLFNGAKPVEPPGAPPATAPASVAAPPAPVQGTPTTDDDGFKGRAAEAAKRVDDALAKNKTALAKADEELVDAVLGAKTGSDEGKARLKELQSSLVDQIHKLGPSLDTPAGQQQLNDFLQSKTQEILGIVKSSGMDAESKAQVLDALSERYDAVKDSAGQGGGNAGAPPGGTAPPAAQPPSGATPAGTPGASVPGGGLPADPLLNGLASDPLMGGLGGLAGPGMGALTGLPGAMGSMIPGMGGLGGGLPLGDLGGPLGGAGREASARGHEDHPAAEDGLSANKPASQGTGETPAAKPAPPSASETPAAKPGEGGHTPPAAGPGQVSPAAQPGPDVAVKLPDGSTVAADSPQLAHAARLVLGGASLDDAARQAQVTVLPPGAPVNEPVSPSQLKPMDYAQFTDHRVMALGNGKVWLNGQVTPIEEMPTGPNFLGWARPQVQTAPAAPAATVLAGVR